MQTFAENLISIEEINTTMKVTDKTKHGHANRMRYWWHEDSETMLTTYTAPLGCVFVSKYNFNDDLWKGIVYLVKHEKKNDLLSGIFALVCECVSVLLPNDDFSSSNSFSVMVAVMVFLFSSPLLHIFLLSDLWIHIIAILDHF